MALAACVSLGAGMSTSSQAGEAPSERALQAFCDQSVWWAELYPTDFKRYVTACRRAVLRGDDRVELWDSMRRVYNDIIVRQNLAADDENMTARLSLRRSQVEILAAQDAYRCFRLVSGGGSLGYDPTYYLPENLVGLEGLVLRDFLTQTVTRPVRYELTGGDRVAADSLFERQMGKLSPERRQGVGYILAGYTAPVGIADYEAICQVAKATLEELSTVPIPERSRLAKALLLTARGWMIAQSKTTDPWTMHRGDIPKTEQYPWDDPTPPRGAKESGDAI